MPPYNITASPLIQSSAFYILYFFCGYIKRERDNVPPTLYISVVYVASGFIITEAICSICERRKKKS